MSMKYEICTYFIAQRGILLVNNLVLIDSQYAMTADFERYIFTVSMGLYLSLASLSSIDDKVSCFDYTYGKVCLYSVQKILIFSWAVDTQCDGSFTALLLKLQSSISLSGLPTADRHYRILHCIYNLLQLIS